MDELRIANWQRSKDGSKNRNQPKRISPWAKQGKRYGKTTRKPTEVQAMLARYAPQQ